MKPRILLILSFVIFIPFSLMGQALDTLFLVEGPCVDVNPNATVDVRAGAPSGFIVVSGGWETTGSGSNQFYVPRSLPENSALGGWSFQFRNNGTSTRTMCTFIICTRRVPVSVIESGGRLPERTTLGQNYPNPFNPSTSFEYTLDNRGTVRVEVFNEAGQLITTLVDGMMEAGTYQVSWNGKSSSGTVVSSGTYFYRLVTDGRLQTKKMILLK